jgi:D-alanyl-D-alanine carboxypeptidase/D-alanyl-D-alanine-endopeptidase (penicillin-binding protein 4)
MHRIAFSVLAALVLLLGPVPARDHRAVSPPAAEATAEAAAALHRALVFQVDRALQVTSALGVHVVEVDSGETVYAYNPDEPRVIASNTKLFTTAAILDALGPGYFFETRFLLRGNVRGGVLHGDLGVVGGGDPHISGRDYDGDPLAVFRDWARALAERGVERVTGDLYLDHGLFMPPEVHPDWPEDQLTSWYEAPVDALSFNDNCILVRVWPGRTGRAPQVELVPNVQAMRLENTARTVGGRARQGLIISRQDDVLVVRGAIRNNSGPVETWVTVHDPAIYFGAGLRAALESEGIAFAGRLVPVEQLPGPVWQRVAVHRTDLATAVRVTNKRSQNFYAESLAKLLGARRCGAGSWEDGVRAVSEFAVAAGIPRGSFLMSDGSGMSRENRFTPRHLTTLLRHMFFHPAGLEFAQSLPYGGEDNGSWKKRLAVPPYRGNVFAKTGTLRGVSALSGYAKAVSGKTYAFSIVFNRVGGDAKAAQDRIVMALIDNG